MADTTGTGNGKHRLLPSYRNELSLGNIIALGVMIAGGVGFLLTYEHRMTTVEIVQGFQAHDLKKLDEKIDMARDMRSIRRGVDDLVDQHRAR